MMKFPDTHWIWLPDDQEKVMDRARIVCFRKTFTIGEKQENCKIRISADTRYKLYVNGSFVQYGPARGDDKSWYCDEMDLSSYLKRGKNVLAVEVLRYPVGYAAGNFGMFRTTTPGLLVEDAEETQTPLVTDNTWKCREKREYRVIREAERFAPLMYQEDCSGDEKLKNWKLPEYDDSGWLTPRAYSVIELPQASCPADLQKRQIPQMYLAPKKLKGVVPRYDEDTAAQWNGLVHGENMVEIPAGSRVNVELDAGELTCGYLSLRLRRGTGTTIRILQSEGYVMREGEQIRKEDRTDWVHGELDGYADLYRVAGYGARDGEEVYEPYWFRTFRFLRLEIQTAQEPCELTGLDYLQTGYPLAAAAQVETSDETLQGVWDISLRSLKLCMQETYIDCPFYEQLQYAMDSRNEILYTYMISADDRLARQCMEYFRRSQREDGMINCCYPNYGPNVIPGFSIYYILMVHDHMMYFGDPKLVKKHLPCIDGILNYFDNHLDARGIVGKTGGHISERYWSFIDWSLPWHESVGMPPAGYCGPLTMESLLYIMGLTRAAQLCDYVGRNDTAQEYRVRAEKVKNAVNQYCRDGEGVYLDGPGVYEYSQHCQIFAVLTDTAEAENHKILLERSMDEPEKFAQYTVSTAFYLFRALEKAGLYERTQRLWDTWRRMVKKHLTTCSENETDERSDCHGWGALCLYELPAVTLGVRPAAPGFEKIEIAPLAGYLDWAKGTAATKWGNVKVEWKKIQDGSLDIWYEVPEIMKGKTEVVCDGQGGK